MQISNSLTVLAIAALLGTSSAAQADSSQSQKSMGGREASGARSSSYSDTHASTESISGKVESVRRANFGDSSDGDSVRPILRLTLENGDVALIDVGSEKNLNRLNLEAGDRVSARGHYKNVQGKNVMCAHEVKCGDTVTWINRKPTMAAQGGDKYRRTGSAQHQLSGTISGFRHLNLRNAQGQRQEVSLVNLELDRGKSVVVALGPRNRLNTLNLQRGQEIELTAVPGTIDGRQVLIANRVSADGRTVSTRSGSGQSQYAQRRSGQQGTQTISGRIASFRDINLRARGVDRAKHSLVRLQLADGRSVTVNLGPKTDLQDLNLEQGKQVRITGRRGTIDNRSALFAEQIQVGNQKHSVNWPRAGQRGSQQPALVRGKVKSYTVASIESGTSERVLLNLELQDGRSVVIDAGPDYTPGELNLRNLNLGDQLTIRGRRTTSEGRPLIIADSIEFSDPSQQQRVRERQGQGTTRSQSGASQGAGSAGQETEQEKNTQSRQGASSRQQDQ